MQVGNIVSSHNVETFRDVFLSTSDTINYLLIDNQHNNLDLNDFFMKTKTMLTVGSKKLYLNFV